MLTVPGDLDESALTSALRGGWKINADSMSYLPVGWGSHHWDVPDRAGMRWFVTVDELETKRVSNDESVADGFARLRASLRTAVALRNAGCEFVVAPVPARDGEPAVRVGERFATAVYPFVDGRSGQWGEWTAPLRSGTLGMVARVHTAPREARRQALDEDFSVPFRDLLEAACAGWAPAECGPYTAPAARLLREHAGPLKRWLDRYDDLVAMARARLERNVLTHGEPHPGNVMQTGDGWLLIDWDTALVAPPERDLWHLAADDGTVPGAYPAATGITPLPELIELYRLGWNVKDTAIDAARFFRPHADTADDVKTWKLLNVLIGAAGG